MKFLKRFKLKNIQITALTSILLVTQMSLAQQALDDQEIINIEGVYKDAPKNQPVQSSQTPTASGQNLQQAMPAELKNQQSLKEVNELKDLNTLAPFSEISIIQKKYLPKTERFQFYAGLGLMTNTPWFLNYGGKLNLSYNFTESLGLELSTMFLTSTQREVSKEIRTNNLQPEQFIYTKGYYGLDLVWSPVYGKISFQNSRIIPYEMYFSFGGGSSTTNSQEKNNATGHVGVGQIFAISKSTAFRWDYSLNAFQATPLADSQTPNPSKGTFTDLVFTAGFSFFFPEAKYR